MSAVTTTCCVSALGCCGSLPGEELVAGVGVGGDGLFEESVEQQAAAAGGATVESERELVEVVVEMGVSEAALEGAFEPAFEQ